jgi:hypothetical protein
MTEEEKLLDREHRRGLRAKLSVLLEEAKGEKRLVRAA